MNTRFKKILIVLIVILILVLAGLLVYKFFFKKISPESGGTGQFPSGGQLPPGQQPGQPGEEPGTGGQVIPQAEQRIKAISQEAVYSPTITNDKTQVTYYLRSNGTIWQSNFDGSNLSQTSNNALENLAGVLWSGEKNKTIIIFQDGIGNITKYFYDLSNNKAGLLNKNIQDITWSFDGKKIAYQYYNEATKDNTITVSNPDGSNYSMILKTRLKNLLINWPKGTEIYLQDRPSGIAPSSLYSLNPNTKSLSEIFSDIYGLNVKWSPNGNKILYSKTVSGGKSIVLYVADRNGSNEKSTGISTLIEKCAWPQDLRYLYCAIPKNINEAEVLPDDFYKGVFLSDDDFYKINIETGEKIKLLEDSQLKEIYDTNDVFLSPQEDYLFFINKVNGLLYSIRL